MPNVNAPHGLQPIGTVSGAPWNGKTNLYYIPASDASAWAIGDVVTTIGGTSGGDANGVPQIVRPANGVVNAALRGVVMGFQVSPVGINQGGMVPGNAVNLNLVTVPATKTQAYYALIADDPQLLFLVQGDNVTTLVPATGGGGGTLFGNATFNQAAPSSSASPVSGGTLTTATINTTATFPLKIMSMLYAINADYTAYTQFVVMINNHELSHGTGTTAV